VVLIGIKKQFQFSLIFFLCIGMKVIQANYSYGTDSISLITIDSDSTNAKAKRKPLEKGNSSETVLLQKREFFRTNLRKDISKYEREELGNSISTNSYAINDRFQPNTVSNIVSFNIYDKNLNTHSFSGTQSLMYALNFTFENTVNTKRELFGFEYRFKKALKNNFAYSIRARLERDEENQTYYQLGFRANWKASNKLNLLGLEYFPVRSGPGHVLELYRLQLANYNEYQISKKIKQIALVEGNFYTDIQADFIISSRTEYLLLDSGVFRVLPLVEGAYGLGSANRRDSYPYWMAEKRVYGGGGFALGLGSENSTFQMIADASIFAEAGQVSFERYTGNLSYRVKDLATINAGYEVYTIENFYSNVFQLGMVYNFK